MKLILKFNLCFLVIFLIGLAVSGYASRNLLQHNAEQEVLDTAGLLINKAEAVRTYTAQQVAPLLQTQLKYTFLPQSVPSFAAIEVLNQLSQKFPAYTYKAAMLNPTNPRDRAADWEADLVDHFKRNPDAKELTGQRDTPSGPAVYLARPLRLPNAACLQCHSTPSAAPPTMVEKYGTANGFGWAMNETLGVHVVSVPLSVSLARADKTWWTVMGMLTAVFLSLGVLLNLMLWRMVIRPVTQLSALADRVSMGELDAPEFNAASKDEIGVLADSFSRMRKSLAHAMKLLES